MKPLIAILILMFAVTAIGQTQKPHPQCELSADTFTLRGFKLGISQVDFDKTYPRVTYRYTDKDKVTNVGFDITSQLQDSMPQYKNVEAIRFKFFDNKLVAFRIDYARSIKWRSDDEFIDTVKETLNTPPSSAWTSGTSWRLFASDFQDDAREFPKFNSRVEGSETSIVCGDFVLLVIMNEYASIEARIPNLQALIDALKLKAEEEKKKQEEQKRKTFKP